MSNDDDNTYFNERYACYREMGCDVDHAEELAESDVQAARQTEAAIPQASYNLIPKRPANFRALGINWERTQGTPVESDPMERHMKMMVEGPYYGTLPETLEEHVERLEAENAALRARYAELLCLAKELAAQTCSDAPACVMSDLLPELAEWLSEHEGQES